MAVGETPVPENLYHVILSTSHIRKDPNNVIEKVRILGTYVSLLAAKAAAHTSLYDAGYEREFFKVYETNREVFESENLPERQGLAVFAVADDGTEFRVRIDTTPNEPPRQSGSDDGRLTEQLYYVIRAVVKFGGQQRKEGTSEVREVNVQGVFGDYEEARKYAGTVLGVAGEGYESVEQAAADERDCGYGENVVVHATGPYGENYLISVVPTQELRGVALAEAVMLL